MDATLSQTDPDFLLTLELGKLLDDHRGIDVIAMDMRPLTFWTDFFVIATVTSNTHLMGLERHIKDYVREKGLDIIQRSRRLKADVERSSDDWCILDLGNIVIHLMSVKARQFFELERLWGAALPIYRTGDSETSGSAGVAHSSKSS